MKKLNNRGFTLVEILAVVAIIAIIGLIAVPSVLSVINTGKSGSYDLLVKNIKTASISLYEEVVYMDANLYHYSADGIKDGNIEVNEVDGSIEINLQTLVRNGFLSSNNDDDNQKKILNPKNNEDIGGCRIKIIKTTSGDEVTYTVESLSTNDICPSTNDYAGEQNKEDDKEAEDSEENTGNNESLEDKALLSTANVGSYVLYNGAKGCINCDGRNANANISESGKGYCSSSYTEFNSSGWRIAYIESNVVYLISAGAPECVEYTYDFDSVAIKYCNPLFSYNGVCNSETTWAMAANDFKKITRFELTNIDCFGSSASKNCNISDDLISVGSYYYFDTHYNSTEYYYTIDRFYLSSHGNNYGVRPVIKLDPNIIVTGGTGTELNPYQISKQ